METEKQEFAERLFGIREKFFRKVLTWMVLAVFVGLPFSLARWPSTGFLPIYALHFGISCLIFTSYFYRSRLNPNAAYVAAVLPFVLIAVSGALSFGLQSPSLAFALFAAFLSLVAWGLIAGLTVVVSFTVFYIATGYAYWSGLIVSNVQPEAYGASVHGWANMIATASVVGGLLLFFCHQFLRNLRNLVQEIQRQKDEIQAQKQEIEHLANHDALTGLPTLRLARENIETAVALAERNNYRSALLFLDLDGFKQVNDTYGHEAGDEVLKSIADRLLSIVRNSDTASRVGGDEFLVLLSKVDQKGQVSVICKRLIEEISAPVDYDGKQLSIGVSIGVALYPDHAENARELRTKSDEIMYDVKRSGKNNYRFADEPNVAANAPQISPQTVTQHQGST